jgi:hypothetical protein
VTQIERVVDWMNTYLPEEYRCRYVSSGTEQGCKAF